MYEVIYYLLAMIYIVYCILYILPPVIVEHSSPVTAGRSIFFFLNGVADIIYIIYIYLAFGFLMILML